MGPPQKGKGKGRGRSQPREQRRADSPAPRTGSQGSRSPTPSDFGRRERVRSSKVFVKACFKFLNNEPCDGKCGYPHLNNEQYKAAVAAAKTKAKPKPKQEARK